MEILRIHVVDIGTIVVSDSFDKIIYEYNSTTHEGWYHCWKDGKIFRDVNKRFVIAVDYKQ